MPGTAVLGALLDLEDGWIMFTVDGEAMEKMAIEASEGWFPAWGFEGSLGIRLDGRFAYGPPPGFLPIRRTAVKASPQVVGILVSDDPESETLG
mmetsp:Transcript_8484/g.15504  ORF Transcript_8484/g.15504 Transcript_8484/m.15504 type:complete len:94 (-) Transcript_8484:13-294(-)